MALFNTLRRTVDLFLDCEWADVLASELVSLALVSADGRHVFYAEREPLPGDPQAWAKAVVYPLLDRGNAAMTDATMTRKLREFLASVGDKPCIRYDFGADRGLCQYVIDGFEVPQPEGPVPVDLQWRRCDDMQAVIEQWWANHPEAKARRHHALTDAHALRAAWHSKAITAR